MKHAILTIKELQEHISKNFRVWCKDKSIPLKERWDLFIQSELGDRTPYYWSFTSFDQDEFHDGGVVRKHQTCTPSDVLERFKPDSGWEMKWEGNYNKEVDKFKEEVLQQFIYSWEFDW